MSEFCVQST